MKTVIIGGVAAGTKVAAKLKRVSPNDDVVIYTKGESISYAGCGLPYYVGGEIESRDELIVNTPAKFSGLTGVEVCVNTEIVAVNPEQKVVVAKSGERIPYDRLVIAAGAEPIVPKVGGVELDGVFTVRTPDDAVGIRDFADANGARRAVIVGGGFIGLEVAENLKKRGISVTVIDMAAQIMPKVYDPDMADYIRRKLVAGGERILVNTSLLGINPKSGESRVGSVSTGAGTIEADIVVLAIGIKPSTAFLEGSGIELERGLVVVDGQMKTNVADIYAAGDCALVKNRVSGRPQWSAMGSTANITGRILAVNVSGAELEYPGCLGTGVVKLSGDLCASRVGLGFSEAGEAGFEPVSATVVVDDKPHYMADSGAVVIKVIGDRRSLRLLGVQAVGSAAVDKIADSAVVGISLGAKVSDYVSMDFSYAPPFSTAIHPLAAACTVFMNKIGGQLMSVTPMEYASGAVSGYKLIDAHPAPTLVGTGAEWVDVTKPESVVGKYAKDEKLLLVCARGKRGYLLQNKLRALGYENTRVLEGGATFNVIKKKQPAGSALPPEEIKRVKGLGCLVDKRYGDVFNVRVITRNGKITTEEHRAIAEAADKFGSGEVTMTTRLTMEIQGVPYGNIDGLIEFLGNHGLETGGTGSLVRPVASCKGTTCQYGLIDTFDLSDKLHERFYEGYHKVTLPHKFKIAVGGCPNNCVKPNLNDLGIIGQRVPVFDFSKCRGCKKCQVETSCPIKIAKVEDGVLRVNPSECNGCGRCKGKCPFGVAEEYVNGYKVYIGGRWGKKVATGRPLSKIFTSEEEVMDVVERAVLLFRDEGITGERFADTIARLGFEYVEEKLTSGAIDKEEILKKNVKGGATC